MTDASRRIIGEAALSRRAARRGVIGSDGGHRGPSRRGRRGRHGRRGDLQSRPATCSGGPSPASSTLSTPSWSSFSVKAPRPGRHWSFGFEPAFRSHLIPSRRGISVAVETWQDDEWAQGAAALVLATPFDDGVAGDQGRLVRERLVEHVRPSR